jgi:hypothetical protein
VQSQTCTGDADHRERRFEVCTNPGVYTYHTKWQHAVLVPPCLTIPDVLVITLPLILVTLQTLVFVIVYSM